MELHQFDKQAKRSKFSNFEILNIELSNGNRIIGKFRKFLVENKSFESQQFDHKNQLNQIVARYKKYNTGLVLGVNEEVKLNNPHLEKWVTPNYFSDDNSPYILNLWYDKFKSFKNKTQILREKIDVLIKDK